MSKRRIATFVVGAVFLFIILGSVASLPAYGSTDAFKKFSFSYFPSFDTGRIGVTDQMEIELNLSSSGDAFYAGVPITVSSAGGILGNSSETYVKNVTILFTGASPDASQPANGIVLGQVAVAGIVLLPTSYCPTNQNGAIFSQPILCGHNSTILWRNTGIYHPIVTVYYSNGTKPFVDNDTRPSDIVTVVDAPPNISVTITNQDKGSNILDYLNYIIFTVVVGAATLIGFYWQYKDRRKQKRMQKSRTPKNAKPRKQSHSLRQSREGLSVYPVASLALSLVS